VLELLHGAVGCRRRSCNRSEHEIILA
jgi:hypothetical protein